MTLVLQLTPELESLLSKDAARQGLSISEYAMQLLQKRPYEIRRQMNGADLVEYWKREGLIGTRDDITHSSDHARTIREKAQLRSHE